MRYIPPAPCLLPPASKRQSVYLTNMRSAIHPLEAEAFTHFQRASRDKLDLG